MSRRRAQPVKSYDPNALPLVRPFSLYLDKELNLLHSDRACPEAKIAVKYNYLVEIPIRTKNDAKEADRNHKACPRCEAVDQKKKKADQRAHRKNWGRKARAKGLDFS